MVLCAYISCTDNKCRTKGSDNYIVNEKLYCKKHYAVMLKRSQYVGLCEYVTKTDKQCKLRSKQEYTIENKFYCKSHYVSLNKKINKPDSNEEDKPDSNEEDKTDSNEEDKTDSNEEDKTDSNEEDKPDSNEKDKTDSDEEDKPESNKEDKPESNEEDKTDFNEEDKNDSNIKQKIEDEIEDESDEETSKKCKDSKLCQNENCTKKSNVKGEYNNKKYCLTHYNKIVNDESKELMKEVKKIEKVKITQKNKNDIKKELYKLLLRVHPDKCTNPKIDATVVTQNLNKILEKCK